MVYSPECVEGVSLLKNSLGACFHPGFGAQTQRFRSFRARFVVAIGSMPPFSTGWHLPGTSVNRLAAGLVAPVTCLGALVAPISKLLLITFGGLLSSHPRSSQARFRLSLPVPAKKVLAW